VPVQRRLHPTPYTLHPTPYTPKASRLVGLRWNADALTACAPSHQSAMLLALLVLVMDMLLLAIVLAAHPRRPPVRPKHVAELWF
jgi:hypothetical protein